MRKLARSMQGSATLGAMGRDALWQKSEAGRRDKAPGDDGGDDEGDGGGEDGASESPEQKEADAAKEPSAMEELEEEVKNPAMGWSTMITHHALKLDNKEDCENSPFALGGMLLQWQEVEELDGEKKDTCCVDPSVAYGLLFLLPGIYYGTWCVCCKGRERFIGDSSAIRRGEAFDEVGLLGPFLRNSFCVPCICCQEGTDVGARACLNNIEQAWCCCCIWADTHAQTGYKPEWLLHIMGILSILCVPLELCFAGLRAHARTAMQQTAKEKEPAGFGMNFAVHTICPQPAILQEALVAELVFPEGPPPAQHSMCSLNFFTKEYRVTAEVGITDRLEVKHCKILRMVPVGSIVVQVVAPKIDPSTGMSRVFVKDAEGQGWMTIVNNRQKTFLTPESRSPFARGTPAPPPEDQGPQDA